MTKVFMGGSRRVTRLDASILERLDNIIAKDLPIVIGDANGADKAVQQYLFSRHYRNVEVFCSGHACRNNVGHWATRQIEAGTQERSYRFYAAKDRAMAEEATFGFMVWDGASTGTLLNAMRLVRQSKKVVIYSVPEHSFSELKARAQWEAFIARCDPELRSEVRQKAAIEDGDGRKRDQHRLLPATSG